MTLDWKETAI